MISLIRFVIGLHFYYRGEVYPSFSPEPIKRVSPFIKPIKSSKEEKKKACREVCFLPFNLANLNGSSYNKEEAPNT